MIQLTSMYHEPEYDDRPSEMGVGPAMATITKTDGTAVLGWGDIGPEAALPVMEGKACLFKTFGGAAALLADSIRSKEPVCYEDLGTEAICGLEVEDFYAIVGINSLGNSLL